MTEDLVPAWFQRFLHGSRRLISSNKIQQLAEPKLMKVEVTYKRWNLTSPHRAADQRLG